MCGLILHLQYYAFLKKPEYFTDQQQIICVNYIQTFSKSPFFLSFVTSLPSRSRKQDPPAVSFCLWPVLVGCPGCVPTSSLLQPTRWACRVRKEKALRLRKGCSARAETLVPLSRPSPVKSKARLHEGCCEEYKLYPSQA